LRGKAFASFSSMSQIATGESASAGRTGGFFCTSVAGRRTAGTKRKPNTNDDLLDKRTTKFIKSHMIGGKHSQQRKEFCRIRIPNSQFARADLILK
jgi:hypothetical protein